MAKFLVALFSALALSSCSSLIPLPYLPDADVQVAFAPAPPAEYSWSWRRVGGLGLDVEEESPYWVRVRSKAPGAAWQVYGPVAPGDTVAIRQEGASDPQYLALKDEGQPLPPGVQAGLRIKKPRITVGKPKVTIPTSTVSAGPVIFDVPKINITVGKDSGPAQPPTSGSALKAGLEPDPVRNPSDPQEAFCQNPIRAFNREAFFVRVSWVQRTAGNPTCPANNTSNESLVLQPGQAPRVFCSLQTSPSSTCSTTTSFSNVVTQRVQ